MKEVIAYVSHLGWIFVRKGFCLSYNEMYDYSQMAQSSLKNFLIIKESTCLGTSFLMEETLSESPVCKDFGILENHMVGFQYSKSILQEIGSKA